VRALGCWVAGLPSYQASHWQPGNLATWQPGIQSVLDPAGPQAASTYWLWNVFLWITTAVYLIVIIVLMLAVLRARRREAPSMDDERPLTIGVSVGAGLTIAILLGLLVASVAIGRDTGTFANTAKDQIEIDVTGHQWWWEVQYPDPESDKSFKTANEIHIPLGRPILLRLATRDVIHSLWIPNLSGKRDLIPGRVNKIRIQADRAGVFRAQCAEFCGMQHAHMSLVVVAEDAAKFEAWKTHQQSPANEAATPQQIHGREVFLSMPCANCHSITGIDAYATLGPDLTHLASRPTLAAGQLLNTKGNLAGWIVNAAAIKPGTAMPPNQISGADLQDLLAYLENLR
jgi:cytochrome c oxidase subunit II